MCQIGLVLCKELEMQLFDSNSAPESGGLWSPDGGIVESPDTA
jgi:hypothetical protein